jgi:hypothetical protein
MRKTLRIAAILAVVLPVSGYAGARLASYFASRNAADDEKEARQLSEDAMRRQILQKQEDTYRRMKQAGTNEEVLRKMARQNAGLWREHGDEATAKKWEELAK